MEKRKYGFKRGHIETLEPRNLLAADYPVINLAEFQATTSDSATSGTSAIEATDGIVSNDSRWFTNATGPHWLEVELAAEYPVGSAQLYLGFDDGFTVSSFEVQYHDGSTWQTAASVTGNTATDVNLLFASPIEDATRFRFYTTESVARVKEFVLLPPTNDGSAHPIGTAVNLNLASLRAPLVSSIFQDNYGVNAVDGYVDDSSRWLAVNSSGPHTIELPIPSDNKVGSIHLYSGVNSGSVLSDFTIEYDNGSGWQPISGGTVSSGLITGNSVTGNTSDALVVDFATPVITDNIRISFTTPYGRIREIVVLPENVLTGGGSGYAIGTSVEMAAPPTTKYTDYHDDWYRIAARSNGNSLISDANGSSQADGTTTDEEKRYQLLYSYASNAFRIRNADTGKAIEVKDASRDAGAAIVEGEYSAAPHQLWRLEPTDTGYFQIVNVWSGMVLETDNGNPRVVTQQPKDLAANPNDNQEWIPEFQDNYFKKGSGGWVGSFNTGWAYNWNRSDITPTNPDFYYVPMQHRDEWPNLSTLHKSYQDWNNDVWPNLLLGYNEPDRPDQADMTVSRGLELWPRLEALDVPLVAPANAQGGEDWWLTPFMDQADSLGYRTDYSAGHWYAFPNVNNIFNHIDDLQNDGNGRKVWLTEFSVVDWSGGSGNFSEEDNYNFILEFLWRAESKQNLDKYAIFLFTGNSPTNPWDLANPRSNFRFSNGNLTPFGKAYSAWDGVTSVQDNTAYVIHNRHARHRIQNDGGSTPEYETIRVEDDSVQWTIEDAGGGKKYLTSLADGRRLRYNGSTLDYAPQGTTGSSVEWDIQQEQYGWHNIVHSSTGEYLRLARTNDANNAPISINFEMVSASAAAGFSSTDWWFVLPNNAAQVPDLIPPSISNFTFHGDTDQSVVIEFSEPILTATVDQTDIVVRNLDTGQILGERDMVIFFTENDTFTLDMRKAPLADGNWEVEVVDSSFTDLAGNPVTGVTNTFSVLAGDANGDLRVTASDHATWAQDYGSTTNLTTDWNRDGIVNAADFTMWRDNLGTILSPPPAAAVAPGSSPEEVFSPLQSSSFDSGSLSVSTETPFVRLNEEEPINETDAASTTMVVRIDSNVLGRNKRVTDAAFEEVDDSALSQNVANQLLLLEGGLLISSLEEDVVDGIATEDQEAEVEALDLALADEV